MVFTSTAVIAAPLLAIALAMAGLMVAIMVALVYIDGHQPMIHLSETGVPPQLTLEKGLQWHLFL